MYKDNNYRMGTETEPVITPTITPTQEPSPVQPEKKPGKDPWNVPSPKEDPTPKA